MEGESKYSKKLKTNNFYFTDPDNNIFSIGQKAAEQDQNDKKKNVAKKGEDRIT